MSRSDAVGSNDGDKRKHDGEDAGDEDIDGVAMDDPVPKKQKISVGFNKTFGSIKSVGANEKKNIAPITIKLGAQVRKKLPFLFTFISQLCIKYFKSLIHFSEIILLHFIIS